MTCSRPHGWKTELGCSPRRAPAHTLLAATLSPLRELGGEWVSPFWAPGTRVVLNIFSYWAEHRGRIPISNVCRRPGLRAASPPTPRGPRGPTPQGHGLCPPGPPSYRQDLLAVQAVAVEQQGVHSVPGASSLHGCRCDIQEVLGAEEGAAKRPGSGLPLIPKHRRVLPPNGEFKTMIWVTDPKPHL